AGGGAGAGGAGRSSHRAAAVSAHEHRGAAAAALLLAGRPRGSAADASHPTLRAPFLAIALGLVWRGDRAGHGAHRRDVLWRARHRRGGAAAFAADVADA